MRCATDRPARIEALPRGGMPGWCDHFLAPPGSGDPFASRTWFDTVLAGALPPDAEPIAVDCGATLLLLLRQGGGLGALATPYTLEWRPLPGPDASAAALRDAGRRFGRLLRLRPPVRLDALDRAAPGLPEMLEGLRAAGLRALRYAHFGNWHDEFAVEMDWAGYLAARPPALRTTITRKLARAGRDLRFTLDDRPGAPLESGIAAYADVRARSWKPFEPFPEFDAALMRAFAGNGALRLGVLRGRADDRPVAAQYWLVAGRRAWLLKLAHAEDSRAASPGTALTALMIRHLMQEDAVRALDFGRGDDAYKRLWVARRRQREGYMLVDPRHPSGLLALARHAAGAARRRLRGGEAAA